MSHNPYFNRWFSAINKKKLIKEWLQSHNPYFNRWFSAILCPSALKGHCDVSQSLF